MPGALLLLGTGQVELEPDGVMRRRQRFRQGTAAFLVQFAWHRWDGGGRIRDLEQPFIPIRHLLLMVNPPNMTGSTGIRYFTIPFTVRHPPRSTPRARASPPGLAPRSFSPHQIDAFPFLAMQQDRLHNT